MTIHLGLELLLSSSCLPEPPPADHCGESLHVGSYLALHRVGFTMPANVAAAAVRSYRTLSP